MKEQLLQLSNTLNSCQAQLKQSEEVKLLLESELMTMRSVQAHLQETLKATKKDARRREANMESLQEAYTAMSKELTICKQSLKTRKEDCLKENDRLKAEIERQREELKQRDLEKAELKAELMKFQDIVSAGDSAIRAARGDMETVRGKLERQVKTLKEREATLVAKLTAMKQECEELQEELMTYKSKSRNSEQFLTLFKNALQHKEHEVHKQKYLVRQEEAKGEALLGELYSLSKTVRVLKDKRKEEMRKVRVAYLESRPHSRMSA